MQTVSVIIPSNRPAAALQDCLAGLAEQTLARQRFEVLICTNGAARAGFEPRSELSGARLSHLHTQQASAAAARNLGIEAAGGDLLLFLNDDVRPAPDCLERHLAAHRELGAAGLVLGAAPWRVYADQTLLERVIAETSLIFFYDQMQARRSYGFRHAWSLNLSVPRRLALAERFDERLSPVNFEDIEWAWRLERRFDARVWYEPAASVRHDHRYTLDDYLRREAQCGGMAVKLWDANPECFEAIFGRPLDAAYEGFMREALRSDAPHAAHATQSAAVRQLADSPCAALSCSPAHVDTCVGVLFAALQPLRRATFRRGMLDALDANSTVSPCGSRADVQRPCERCASSAPADRLY